MLADNMQVRYGIAPPPAEAQLPQGSGNTGIRQQRRDYGWTPARAAGAASATAGRRDACFRFVPEWLR